MLPKNAMSLVLVQQSMLMLILDSLLIKHDIKSSFAFIAWSWSRLVILWRLIMTDSSFTFMRETSSSKVMIIRLIERDISRYKKVKDFIQDIIFGKTSHCWFSWNNAEIFRDISVWLIGCHFISLTSFQRCAGPVQLRADRLGSDWIWTDRIDSRSVLRSSVGPEQIHFGLGPSRSLA